MHCTVLVGDNEDPLRSTQHAGWPDGPDLTHGAPSIGTRSLSVVASVQCRRSDLIVFQSAGFRCSRSSQFGVMTGNGAGGCVNRWGQPLAARVAWTHAAGTGVLGQPLPHQSNCSEYAHTYSSVVCKALASVVCQVVTSIGTPM